MSAVGFGAAPRTARYIGLGVLMFLAALILLGSLLWQVDPAGQSLRSTLLAPSAEHLLGTDHLGRDMLARMVSGAYLTLSLAVLSVATAAVPGVMLGLIAGSSGGWLDRLISGFADAVLALPGLLLVLILGTIATGSWWALYVGLSLTLWVEYFRFTRARTRILAMAPSVEASRMLGFKKPYIFRRHFWPELAPGLATIAAFGTGTAITAVSALGFIGVGLRPPTAEWGVMMAELLPYWREAPWLIAQPVLAVTATVFGLQLIASGRPEV